MPNQPEQNLKSPESKFDIIAGIKAGADMVQEKFQQVLKLLGREIDGFKQGVLSHQERAGEQTPELEELLTEADKINYTQEAQALMAFGPEKQGAESKKFNPQEFYEQAL